MMEPTRIVIGSTLRTKHQAHPGRQEWISMLNYLRGWDYSSATWNLQREERPSELDTR
ncbi:hypothetical protein BJ878DRAFT_506 [Calycina marina]|uniref:Uncharacterized protein n=1 Tax=Calycina marina TaxID=1763456 RepID=A0A9P8CL49_9HELO|nr:hypothetical protein BJ878DRAFT_506 [Calycina marina]